MSLRFDFQLSKKLKQLITAITLTSMVFVPSFTAAQSPTTLKQSSQDFTSVAKVAIPAVVSIRVKANAKQKSLFSWGQDDDSSSLFQDDFFQRFFGIPRHNQEQQETPIIGQASGFIVAPDGYIITNSHVIKDASEINVILNDGREFVGKVIGQDPNTDIAVVKIDANDLPFIKLGNSDDLEVGQWVVTIGNPLGLQASLTVGVVSAKGRNNLDLARIEDFIQTDAAINKGNSGGPLLNLNAEAVGMNTAIVTNGSSGYMGIGFAIPSNMIKQIMDELIHTGSVSRGFLGVSLQQVDSGLAKAFNLEKTEGALVADVTKGSPAERAGLKQGDIILRFNNQHFPNIAALRNSISLMKPGTRMTLTVLREGNMIQVPVDIGIFPKEQELAGVENNYGFEVQNLTPELAQGLGYKEESGVVITKINPNGVAAWTGLKKGALILEVNRQKVHSLDQFNKELAATEKGKPLLLLVKQGDSVRYISMQMN